MSALLLLNRAGICRQFSRCVIWTLSRRNYQVLTNKVISSEGAGNVLSRCANVRKTPHFPRSERTLTGQPQKKLIQVNQSVNDTSAFQNKTLQLSFCLCLVVEIINAVKIGQFDVATETLICIVSLKYLLLGSQSVLPVFIYTPVFRFMLRFHTQNVVNNYNKLIWPVALLILFPLSPH